MRCDLHRGILTSKKRHVDQERWSGRPVVNAQCKEPESSSLKEEKVDLDKHREV